MWNVFEIEKLQDKRDGIAGDLKPKKKDKGKRIDKR